MAHPEMGVLVILLLIVAVPTLYVVVILRMVMAAYRFDRHFKGVYPDKAKEVTKRWPAWMSRLGVAPLFRSSFWENDMPTDPTLDALKRKAIHSFLALSLLTILLTFLGTQCAPLTDGVGSP